MSEDRAPKKEAAETTGEKAVPKTKTPPPRWTPAPPSSSVYLSSVLDEATDDCVLKFGKHRGSRFQHVHRTEPGYCSWCLAHLRNSTPNHAAWLTYLHDHVLADSKKSSDDDGWEEISRVGEHWKERIEFLEEQLKVDKMGNTFRSRLEMVERENQELRDSHRELSNSMFEMSQRYLAMEGHLAQLTAWLANQSGSTPT